MDEEARRLTILVIDSDDAVQRAASEELSEEYELILSDSAQKATELIESRLPDIIFMDWETGGEKLLQAIRQRDDTRAVPVMLLTASKDKETVRKLFSLKCSGVSFKPSVLGHLKMTARDIILHEAEKQNKQNEQ